MLGRRGRFGVTGCVLLLAALCACSSPASTSSTQQTPSRGRATSPTSPPLTSPSQPSRPTTSGSPSQAPATEFHPPGDIPDSQVFIGFRVPGSTIQIKVPEGWARASGAGGTTTFSDHYNSIAVEAVKSGTAPTVSSALHVDVPQLRRTTTKFTLDTVTTVQRLMGRAVLITYFIDSASDPVTGKVVRDAVERYLFWHNGQEAILTLTGPKGSDNVDPWRTVTDSLRWQ